MFSLHCNVPHFVPSPSPMSVISAEEMEALKTPIKTWLNTANKDISLEG